jgi:hypothetical protein
LIPDIDIWRAAALMTQCFRREAASQAALCAEELLAAREVDGCAMWTRIVAAIERLQAVQPAEGEGNALRVGSHPKLPLPLPAQHIRQGKQARTLCVIRTAGDHGIPFRPRPCFDWLIDAKAVGRTLCVCGSRS